MRKIVVLLGPPGSGKGTQAKLLAARLGLPHISTGDMLRLAVAEGSELGQKILGVMETGALVSDDLMHDVVKVRLAKPDCRSGAVLDGFPRTLRQTQDLSDAIAGDEHRVAVILIRVPEATLWKRIVGRRSCECCGKVFNIYNHPSVRDDVCDACGGRLIQRKDDLEDVVTSRLNVYNLQTEPLVMYYEELGLLHVVDGERDVDTVNRALVDIVSSL